MRVGRRAVEENRMRVDSLMLYSKARRLATILAALAWMSAAASAQQPIHYFHRADLPPGTVGQGQLQRFLPLQGYYQPVEVQAPQGARISVLAAGSFSEPVAGPLLVGMQVGHVYQLKISSIPYYEDFELFPTIEVINRLYPPEGKAKRFPVPIDFTQEELELALSGRFVTRVVYLEDRGTALPQLQRRQPFFEAAPGQDPLRVADQFGRPMLIMRMGSRVPGAGELSNLRSGVTPPAVIYPPLPDLPAESGGSEDAIERQGFNIPRVHVPRYGRPVYPPVSVPEGR